MIRRKFFPIIIALSLLYGSMFMLLQYNLNNPSKESTNKILIDLERNDDVRENGDKDELSMFLREFNKDDRNEGYKVNSENPIDHRQNHIHYNSLWKQNQTNSPSHQISLHHLSNILKEMILNMSNLQKQIKHLSLQQTSTVQIEPSKNIQYQNGRRHLANYDQPKPKVNLDLSNNPKQLVLLRNLKESNKQPTLPRPINSHNKTKNHDFIISKSVKIISGGNHNKDGNNINNTVKGNNSSNNGINNKTIPAPYIPTRFTTLTSSFHILSTFLDRRLPTSTLKMFVLRENSDNSDLICKMKLLVNSNMGHIAYKKHKVVADKREMSDNHDKQFGGWIYSCPLPWMNEDKTLEYHRPLHTFPTAENVKTFKSNTEHIPNSFEDNTPNPDPPLQETPNSFENNLIQALSNKPDDSKNLGSQTKLRYKAHFKNRNSKTSQNVSLHSISLHLYDFSNKLQLATVKDVALHQIEMHPSFQLINNTKAMKETINTPNYEGTQSKQRNHSIMHQKYIPISMNSIKKKRHTGSISANRSSKTATYRSKTLSSSVFSMMFTSPKSYSSFASTHSLPSELTIPSSSQPPSTAPSVPTPSPKFQKLAVCVPPLYGDISLQKVVNFVEMCRIYGAHRIFLYIQDIHPDLFYLLQEYSRMNTSIVSLVQWDLPVLGSRLYTYLNLSKNVYKLPTTKSISSSAAETSSSSSSSSSSLAAAAASPLAAKEASEAADLSSSSSSSSSNQMFQLPSSSTSSPSESPASSPPPPHQVIWNRGQSLAINHCLYSQMSTFDWVLFQDLDEMLVTKKWGTWQNLIQNYHVNIENNSFESIKESDNKNDNNNENNENINFSKEESITLIKSIKNQNDFNSTTTPYIVAGFSIPSVLFSIDFKAQTKYAKEYFQKLRRSSKIDTKRNKVLIRTLFVEEVGIHHVSRLISYSPSSLSTSSSSSSSTSSSSTSPLLYPNRYNKNIPKPAIQSIDPENALIHHYRDTTMDTQLQEQEQEFIFDDAMIKFRPQLINATSQVLDYLQLKRKK